MHNRTMTILLLLTSATLVTAAGPPAEPPDALEQAKQLANAGQYEQAEQLYQAILADRPTVDQALAAQKGLAIVYVRSGQGTEAKQALEDLIGGYSDHWDIGRAVTHVADACRETGKHSDALQTYGQVIAAWPDDEHALWSQMGVAMSQACLKDAKASDAAVEELCTSWQGHHHLGRALCIVADNWRRLNTHDKARDVYTRALASDPDPEFAMWSRMGLTISGIHLGGVESAEADADRLISDFVGDPRSSIAACLAADQLRACHADRKAAELYKYVVDIWPQTEHAIWSQMGLAICHIHMEDETAADADVEGLLANFPRRENLGLAVEQILHQYHLRHEHEKAEQLLERVIAKQADANLGPLGKANAARLRIRAGDDQTAEVLLSEVLADYRDHELLPEAVKLVAEGYYLQALLDRKHLRPEDGIRHFQSAIRTYQIITEQLPPTAQTTPEAYYFIACAYRKMEQYADAIAYYGAVVEYWPDWERASKAQYRIARCWERLTMSRQVPKLDGIRQVVRACEQLIAKYPDSGITKSTLPYFEYWRNMKARYEGEEK